jgi:AcrR family transcriptional regulator
MASRRKRAPDRRAPSQARAQVTVSSILEAAGQILLADGLRGFNTNRIAERAGVSIGTLYGYFPNKRAILIALARQLLQEDGKTVLSILDENHDGQARKIVRALLERHRRNTAYRRIVISTYLGEGLGPNDARQVEEQIAVMATHPGGPFANLAIDPVQLFVATRAVLGVARALTEDGVSANLNPRAIEDETMRLLSSYLGHDLE